MIELRIDDKQLRDLERLLAGIPRALPRVMSRSLNRTATEARTTISRDLSAESGLKVKDVRDRLSLRKATYAQWRSGVKISRRRVPLMAFGARQTRRGVTYKKGSGRTLVQHAFIARMKSGHSGVFKRREKARLPISELRGPSIAQVFVGAEDRAARLYKESMAKLQKNIHDQVNLILARRIA